jgi:nucleoside-diphosphate-sugar epimerase
MSKLIFGCGYLGSRAARRWREAGEEVFVVTRSPERAEAFEAEDYRPLVADVTEPRSLRGLPEAKTVLFAVGLDRSSGKTLDEVYVRGLANVLAALPKSVERVIYVSSTGVYGPHGGGWVDEATPCEPLREGGRASLAAEERLRADRLGERAIVLRMAGLYGPDRIPLAEKLRAGAPIPAPAEGYLNQIHLEDAVEVVLAAERRARPPRVYCVSDGHPPARREYYAELARLLNAPPPRFVTPDADSPAARRAAADKRVSNRRLLDELKPRLRYPTFRAGLAAIVASAGGEIED